MLRDPDDEDAFLEFLAEHYSESNAETAWERLLAALHPKQRAFVEDQSPRKCALKGRRGGGSYGSCAWLAERWQEWPNTMSVFIAGTKEHAKNILWPTLETLDKRFGWNLSFNAFELTATWPNGYQVGLKGAKDRAQIEKLRGFSNGLRRCAIDECGGFSSHDPLFRYLIQSILSPQLMDHRHRGGGQLALISSPGLDPYGFFFEKTTGKDHMGRDVAQWSTHHWTALDNPHVDARSYFLEELVSGGHIIDGSPAEEVVEALLSLRGIPQTDERWASVSSKLTASFRREYLAHWVKDADSLVYRISPENLLPHAYQLPAGNYRITIGCDIGWGDGNGFAVAAKNIFSREVILLHGYYLPELSTREVADELRRLAQHWHTNEIYVDCGAEGERLLLDLSHYGVLAQAAGKGRKKPRIEYLRSLLQSRHLKVRPEFCQDLLVEWSALPWSEDRQSHRDGFVDDVSDAALMAVMPLSQHQAETDAPKPLPGTPEALKAQDDWELQQAMRQGRRMAPRWGKRLPPARRR